MEKWPAEGDARQSPTRWLVSAGRFRAIDALRRNSRFESFDESRVPSGRWGPGVDAGDIEDDRLRLVFTCCHPVLNSDAQVALTLREVCGLTTEEIARAFLVPAATLAQRIVRAKAKIREEGVPYQVPEHQDLPPRLDAVLRVVLSRLQRRLRRLVGTFAHPSRSLGRSAFASGDYLLTC